MSDLGEARRLIDSLKRYNGGMTREERAELKRDRPEVLEIIDNLKNQLGKSTET